MHHIPCQSGRSRPAQATACTKLIAARKTSLPFGVSDSRATAKATTSRSTTRSCRAAHRLLSAFNILHSHTQSTRSKLFNAEPQQAADAQVNSPDTAFDILHSHTQSRRSKLFNAEPQQAAAAQVNSSNALGCIAPHPLPVRSVAACAGDGTRYAERSRKTSYRLALLTVERPQKLRRVAALQAAASRPTSGSQKLCGLCVLCVLLRLHATLHEKQPHNKQRLRSSLSTRKKRRQLARIPMTPRAWLPASDAARMIAAGPARRARRRRSHQQ